MNKNIILLASVITLLLLVIVPQIIIEEVEQILTVATRRAGGEDVMVKFLVVIIIGFAIITYYFVQLIHKRFLRTFCILIILLPIIGLAEKVFYITAHTRTEGGEQKLSLTTLMIFVQLLFMSILSPSSRKVVNKNVRFQLLLLSFAVCITLSQFFNHSIYEAIMLSIGAIWQYVALFYILVILIEKDEDIITIFKSVILAVLWNIGFRAAISDQIATAVRGGEDIWRVSGLVFGPAVSYAGYVACVLILSIFLIFTIKSKTKKIMWILVMAIILIELGNTNTRGALLSFILGLIFLLSWRKYRKTIIGFLMLLGALYIVGVSSNLIDQQRSFIDLEEGGEVEIHGPSLRWQIFTSYLPHFFDNMGFGNGLGNDIRVDIQIGTESKSLSAHNIIEDLAVGTGAISAIMFLVMFGYVCMSIFSRIQQNKQHNDLLVFIMSALLTWFFFANSTGTSIVYYYPYEAIIIFYVIFFSGIILAEAQPARHVDNRKGNVIQCARDTCCSVYTASLHSLG